MRLLETLAGVTALLGGVAAQLPRLPVPSSCSGVPKMRYTYSVAAGWQVTKMAGNLRQVRTIVFDPLGNMLVAEAGKGISAHSFGPDGCINSSSTIIPITALNHGLSLTPDGKTIYASSVTTVFSFSYDPATMKASNQKTVITGMDRGIHSTRTVLVVPQNPNMVLVQVGSNSNLDMQSAQPSVGRSIIKIFDMSKVPASGYNYKTAGEVVAYGLRNEIGFITDPNGGLWGVENSGDDFTRTINGRRTDIHKDNPAEKLNYLGNPLKDRDQWFGYPTCFSVWDPSSFTDVGLKTGEHFVMAPNASYTDATCVGKAIPPRLTFQAHSAPIWNTFDADAKNMYVTFHGSWNRQPPTGFKVVQIPFTKLPSGAYDPVAPSTSMTGYKDIFSAANPASCTANGLTQSNCFRLTAATWDPRNRGVFIGSDNASEGEIYLLSPTS